MNKSQSSGIWIVVILLVICLAAMLFPASTTSTQDISYSQLMKKVKASQSESVSIDKDVLTAKPKGDVTVANVVSPNKQQTSVVYRVMVPTNDPAMYKTLEENNVDVSVKKPSDSSRAIAVLSTLLPLLLIIGFVVLMAKTIQSGGSQAMSFGKSKAKLMLDSKVKVTFKDVAGIDEEKQELEEIVDFLKNGEKYVKLGAKIPKGVLLVGVPGTGKTLMAKAVAGEAGVPFFSISGSDFVEMFVGVGASRVRDLFEQAKKHQPCIIFIDEIDAVGRQRGAGMGGGHDEREQTLNQLLVEMDGFDANTNIIVIAATNRPDILDNALLRQSSCDRKIVVHRPDILGREQILNVHAKNKPLAEDVDLKVLAKRTPGFTGADLQNLLNEAALLAARDNQTHINMHYLEEAIDKVIAGPEKKSRIISDEEKENTAYHEVGHALLAKLLKNSDPLHKVSIIPRGMALGVTMTLPEKDHLTYKKSQLLDRITMLLGGRVAEEIIYGPDSITTGAQNDLEKVTQTARNMVATYGMSYKMGNMAYGKSQENVFMGRDFGHQRDYSDEIAAEIDKEVKKIVDERYNLAKELLLGNRDMLETIAKELLEKETLDEAEFNEIMKRVEDGRHNHGLG